MMDEKWKLSKSNVELLIDQKDNILSKKSSLKCYDKDAEGYIYVTQSGISTIFKNRTPQNIQGFYTDGLQSCLGLLFVGSEAASLVHLTHKMHIQELLKEIKKINNGENLVSAYIIYNEFYGNDESLKDFLRRFFAQIDENIKSVIKLIKAPNNTAIPNVSVIEQAQATYFSISRISLWKEPNINFSFPPEIVIMPGDGHDAVEIRENINIINNFFLRVSGEKMRLDVQYNGDNFTKNPGIRKDSFELEILLKEEPFSNPQNSDLVNNVLEMRESAIEKIKLVYPEALPYKNFK